MRPRAAIVTVSDSRSSGERSDETTGVMRTMLEAAELEVVSTHLIEDERPRITDLLTSLADSGSIRCGTGSCCCTT